MLLVAVTGGIGSGKSTVAAGLAHHGAPLIDADGIARQVVEPGGPAYRGVVDRFGPGVVGDDGSIDRAQLAAVVFLDPDRVALADLNAITHPVIGAEIIRQSSALADHDGPIVLDIPLLDARTMELYRPAALLVVDTPEDLAVGRLIAHRGFSEADARARVAAQTTRQERRDLIDLAPAGRVIFNGGDRAALAYGIDDAWEWLVTLSHDQHSQDRQS